MTTIRSVTGMQDVLPEDRPYWDLVLETAIDLAERYGFQRIDVPIMEYTELFSRGVGTASDVCSAMELGVDGILLNTAIALAQEPVAMARAMRLGVEAGRLAARAGRIPRKLYGSASSPVEGLPT